MIIRCILLSVLAATSANTAETSPPMIKLQMAAAALPVTLNIDTGGAKAFALERSGDLKAWRPSLNVFTKVRFFRIVDRSTISRIEAPQYYKAVAGATQSVEQMRQKWLSQGFGKYKFKVERTCFCDPTFLSATVFVENGRIVGVAEAKTGGAEYPNPRLEQFRSIEELFDMLSTETPKSDVLAVAFDPTMGFPTRIDIDYDIRTADDEIRYQVTDVVATP